MADWTDEYMQLVKDCQARDAKLSAWDADFLDSIEGRLIDKRPLTAKQIETLEGIWERATRKG